MKIGGDKANYQHKLTVTLGKHFLLHAKEYMNNNYYCYVLMKICILFLAAVSKVQ